MNVKTAKIFRFRSALKLTLLPPLGAWVIRFLGRTLRIRTKGADLVDELYREGRHIILAFWHGRQLMMPLIYRGAEVHILISQHRDGELIHRIVARFGFKAVRGSTTRGGTAALRKLIRLGRSGVDLAVTPDGPRGPRQVAQRGVIHLAKATGLPILPCTFSCSKKNSLRVGIASWSRTHGGAACSCGESPSGWRRMRTRPCWKPSGWSWKLPSTG